MKLVWCVLATVLAVVGQAPAADGIGRLDTVGGTTYDYQLKWMAYLDSGYGLHVAWTYSVEPGGGYPDRNLRYNFYDLSQPQPGWVFNAGPNFPDWGVNVFATRCAPGNLDVSPYNHCAYLSAATSGSGGLVPVVAHDVAPGAGSFELSEGPQGYVFPLLAVGHSGRTQVAMQQSPAPGGLYYSGMDTLSVWSDPFHIPPPLPDPEFPDYWVAASKQSARVTVFWLDRNQTPPGLRYRRSTDDGVSWQPPDSLALPPAFSPGSDSLPRVIDLYPWYDPDDADADGLHLVTSLVPVVGESSHMNQAALWHWSDGGGWSQVARVGCQAEHLPGGMGGSSYAGRPSLGYDRALRQWICAWEQFDSANVEPTTGELRADIWACRSDSLGQHWGEPVRLTDPDQTSKRFPCVANAVREDTCAVLYLVDSVAGCAVQGIGPHSVNPAVVRWVPLAQIPPPAGGGVADRPAGSANALRPVWLGACPNPCQGRVSMSYRLTAEGRVRLTVCDAAGRMVAEPVNEMQSAGEHFASWDAAVTPGIYFASLQAGGQVARRKLIVSR